MFKRALYVQNKYQNDITIINKFNLINNGVSKKLTFNLIFIIIRVWEIYKNTSIPINKYYDNIKRYLYHKNKQKSK